jgi:hypothetical protein
MHLNLPSRPHLGVIFAATLLLMAPLFLLGAGGNDLHAQSLWVQQFSAQFFAGDLFPRWLMDLFAGSGAPSFFYCPPLPYFITLIFAPLSGLDAFGFYPIAASMALAMLVAALGFYAWMRDTGLSANAALAGALLYIAAPNFAAQNMDELLLFSSVWAYAFLPLLVLFARRLGLGARGGVSGYSLALAALVLCHIPSVVLFGPISVGYGLLNLPRGHWKKPLARMGAAVALGFALSAFFLLPCLVYLPFLQTNLDAYALMQGQSYEQSAFFFGFDNPQANAYQHYWDFCCVLTILLAGQYKKIRHGRAIIVINTLTLAMMLPIAAPLWQQVPLIRLIQLAERLFMVLALLQAYALAQCWPRWKAGIGLLLIAGIVLTWIVAAHSRTSMESFKQRKPDYYDMYQMKIEQYGGNLPDPHLVERYGTAEGRAQVRAHPEQVAVEDGAGTVEVLDWQPRSKYIAAVMQTPGSVRIRQFLFYGLEAKTLAGELLPLGRDEETGHALVKLPAGKTEFTLNLTPQLPEIVGNGISLLALGVWLLLGLVGMRSRGVTAAKS